MTEEDFEAIKGYTRMHAIPPSPLFPKGLGVDIRIDPELGEGDRPVLGADGKKVIHLSAADYDDLKRRLPVRAEREEG